MADLLAPFAGESAPRLAAALRRKFGTLARALAAPRSQLAGLGEEFTAACDMLLAARELVDTARQEQLSSASVDPSDPALHHYLQSRLGASTQERLLVIFCDRSGQYLLDEEMGWGTSGNVGFNMASLFRRTMELDAAGMLLVHNHPSGRCEPSGEDIEATRRLSETAQILRLNILDHLIVTRTQCYSIRAGSIL